MSDVRFNFSSSTFTIESIDGDVLALSLDEGDHAVLLVVVLVLAPWLSLASLHDFWDDIPANIV